MTNVVSALFFIVVTERRPLELLTGDKEFCGAEKK